MLNEVIEKYNQAQNKIANSHSPRYQLYYITEFFDFLNKRNLRRLYPEFIPDFLKYLINIFKNSVIEFIEPGIFLSSKLILIKACETERDEIIQSEIQSIIEIINIKLILSFYYLGETENGLLILKEILASKEVESSGVSLDYVIPDHQQRKKSVSQNIVNPEVFRVSKAFDILRKINAAIKRKDSYSSAEVNIMLVESENQGDFSPKFGTIKQLECEIHRRKEYSALNPDFENITDIHEEGIHDVRSILINTANKVLKQFNFAIHPDLHQINLRFEDAKAIYKGSSFSAGAAILIAAAFLEYNHSRKKFQIFNNAAITGTIDAEGRLLKLPDISLDVKIETSFFSWVNFLVIPAGNYEEASGKLKDLKKKYPRKNIELIPVNNITDIIFDKRVIRLETDTWPVYAKKKVNRHKGVFYSLLFFVLLAVSGTTIWKTVPRNYKPYPQTTNYMNVIYSPDRDDIWKFTTSDKGGMDTIDFGEIAYGDEFIHRIAFWNNADKKESIQIELEGRDKNDFEVFWGIDNNQNDVPEYVNPDIKQLLYIKFAPTNSGGDKYANFIMFDKSNKDKKLIIPLKAHAGPYNGGYSLHLKDNEDRFTINSKTGNVLGNNFTISFWFKTDNFNRMLLQSENNTATLTKFNVEFSEKDSTLQLTLFRPKSYSGTSISFHTWNKVKINDWNYFAFVYEAGRYWLVLNNDITESPKSENIMQFDDVLTFGTDRSYNTKFEKTGYDFYFAEIQIFNKALSPSDLVNVKTRKKEYDDKNLLMYYDFEETVGHVAFNKSTNIDANADLTGLGVKSLDIPFKRCQDYNSPENEDSYIRTSGKGGIHLNKMPLNSNSAFTIGFECKYKHRLRLPDNLTLFSPGKLNTTLTFLCLGSDSLKFYFSNGKIKGSYIEGNAYYKLDTNWHRYAIDYNPESKISRIFVDGELMTTISNVYFDITREFFFMVFGKDDCYDNPRFLRDTTFIDNITLFNRTLNEDELKMSSPENIKKIIGLVGLWTFSEVKNNACYDKINNIPIFIWEDYKLLKK
ncbi:MAG: LamG domain-containing protein [Bacteroidetes bacterium]|nr:LamG domain-containing protein [Bacteroidota bacterium]